MIYKGWVPTVTGNLSFTAFGDTDYPTAYRRCGNWQRFCIVQSRSSLDTMLPLPFGGWLGRRVRELAARVFLGISGDILYVVAGEWDEKSNQIQGHVSLIPQFKNRMSVERLWVKIGYYFPRRARGFIEHFDYYRFREGLLQLSSADFEFKLQRNGEVTFISYFTSNHTPARRLDHQLADQSYYFLKDCFHKHQHHDPTHDAIISLVRVDNESDESWIPTIQHRLYRQIIRFKRFRERKTLFRASGVLAYAKAFKKNFEHTKKTQEFRPDELEQSLSVSRDEVLHFDSQRLNKIQATIGWVFSVSAFILSIVTIAQFDDSFSTSVSPRIIWMTEFAARFPFGTLALVVSISIILRMVTFKEAPTSWPIVRNIYQLLRGGSLGRYVVVLLFSGFSLILAGSYWLASIAISS